MLKRKILFILPFIFVLLLDTDICTCSCDFNSCVHGTCIDGRYCNCTGTQYHGISCESQNGACASNPCVHGRCIDNSEEFGCICAGTGYTGIYCESSIACDSNPCRHGRCILEDDEYRCNCNDTNFIGEQCEIAIECTGDDCAFGEIVDAGEAEESGSSESGGSEMTIAVVVLSLIVAGGVMLAVGLTIGRHKNIMSNMVEGIRRVFRNKSDSVSSDSWSDVDVNYVERTMSKISAARMSQSNLDDAAPHKQEPDSAPSSRAASPKLLKPNVVMPGAGRISPVSDSSNDSETPTPRKHAPVTVPGKGQAPKPPTILPLAPSVPHAPAQPLAASPLAASPLAAPIPPPPQQPPLTTPASAAAAPPMPSTQVAQPAPQALNAPAPTQLDVLALNEQLRQQNLYQQGIMMQPPAGYALGVPAIDTVTMQSAATYQPGITSPPPLTTPSPPQVSPPQLPPPKQ